MIILGLWNSMAVFACPVSVRAMEWPYWLRRPLVKHLMLINTKQLGGWFRQWMPHAVGAAALSSS